MTDMQKTQDEIKRFDTKVNNNAQPLVEMSACRKYLSQNISPSEKYHDIVKGLSDIKEPSVPDFGFPFHQVSFSNPPPNGQESQTREKEFVNKQYWGLFY